MRVLHVATLLTPDGAYGGPVRVALNQCKALREAGHDATLVAASEGYEVLPTEIEGVPVQLFAARKVLPGIGFAGLSAPGIRTWLDRNLNSFDVVHVHAARDFITLPAARRAIVRKRRLVLQPHGMLDTSRRALALPFDRRFTRPVLRRAHAIFCLSRHEQLLIHELEPQHAPVRAIFNGLAPMGKSTVPSNPPEILFVGRIAEIKRPTLFARAAVTLLLGGAPANFALIGADEGLGDEVRAILCSAPSGIEWRGGLPHSQVLERVSRAYALVQTSVSEVQSLTVLEAAALGVPAIVTKGNSLAVRIAERNAGIVLTDDDPATLAHEMGFLIRDPARRDEMGANARTWVEAEFSPAAMIEALLEGYTRDGLAT